LTSERNEYTISVPNLPNIIKGNKYVKN